MVQVARFFFFSSPNLKSEILKQSFSSDHASWWKGSHLISTVFLKIKKKPTGMCLLKSNNCGMLLGGSTWTWGGRSQTPCFPTMKWERVYACVSYEVCIISTWNFHIVRNSYCTSEEQTTSNLSRHVPKMISRPLLSLIVNEFQTHLFPVLMESGCITSPDSYCKWLLPKVSCYMNFGDIQTNMQCLKSLQ